MPKKRVSENELIMSTAAAPRRKPAATRRVRRPAVITEAVSPAAVPLQEEIARLAYSYWEARGCQGGSPEEDWLRAERELSISSIA
jgi:hypothetical protein